MAAMAPLLLARIPRHEVTALWRLVDECECGDYRHQHGPGRGKEHGGRCTICGPNDGMNGKPCDRFRFMIRARNEPEDTYEPRRRMKARR